MLKRESFLKNVVILAGGTAIGKAIVLLSSPILTRLYTPEDFGRLGVFVSFIGLATIAVSLRLEVAIVVAKEDDEAAYLVAAALFAALLVSLASFIVLYLLVGSGTFGYGILPLWVSPCVYPVLLVFAAYYALRYWFIRRKDFLLISKVAMVRNGAGAAIQILFGALATGWVGLISGDVFGRAFGMAAMLRRSWSDLRRRLKSFDVRKLSAVVKRYYKFPALTLPSSVVDTLVLNLPLPLLAHLHGAAAAGYFALVSRIISFPMQLIGKSTAEAYFGQVALFAREDPRQVRGFFFRISGILALLGLAPALFLLAGPWVFGFVFGESWGTAGLVAAVMAPWIFSKLIVNPLGRLVYVLQRQELKLIYDFLALSGVIATIFLASFYRLSFVNTVALLSGLQVAAYIVFYLILVYVVRTTRRGETWDAVRSRSGFESLGAG